MASLRRHPKTLMAVAFGIAGAVVVLIALSFGPRAFLHAFSHLHPGWLLLVIDGAILAPAAYAVTYVALTRVSDVPPIDPGLAARRCRRCGPVTGWPRWWVRPDAASPSR